MGAFVEMPDGSAEYVEECDYPDPRPYDETTEDPAFDHYPRYSDPQPVWRERPARQDVIRHALGGEK